MRGLGCVTRTRVWARFTQPNPLIAFHVCTANFKLMITSLWDVLSIVIIKTLFWHCHLTFRAGRSWFWGASLIDAKRWCDEASTLSLIIKFPVQVSHALDLITGVSTDPANRESLVSSARTDQWNVWLESLARGRPYMMSAKCSDILTPSPLVTVTNQLVLFLMSAFRGHPSPQPKYGRHIWKPPIL